MEEFAKMQEFASMMEALLGPGMMESSSPFGMMTQQQLCQRMRGDKIPQVYDSTDRCDSSLLKQIFLQAFQEQEAFQKTAKLDQSKISLAQTTRPAIEHDIVPSSFENLKQVSLSDVLKKVNHVHTDCVMLVEVVHVPYRQVGTMVLVRDSNHECMMLALYNYVAADENPKEVFPVGKKLAVLCPFLKNAQDIPQMHLMLRCDNPQFVVSYEDDKYIWKDALLTCSTPTPSELRQMGNQHFQKGNLEKASKCYSKALAHCDIDSEIFVSDKISCWSNRTEVNLRLERWQEAVTDAQEVLQIQADHTKAKFRLAKAWSRVGKASDALILLEEPRSSSGRSSAVKQLARECQRIVKEERGEYDIKAMMKEATTKPGERISSHATFCSPKVAIGVPIDGKESYRGCKALSDIKEGELIMSSKAFAIGWRLSNGITMELDTHEKSLGDSARMEMVTEIVRKLWKTPSLGKELYSLSDGDPSRAPIDHGNLDKIDLKRIRDILRCNSFSLTPYDSGIRRAWEKLGDIPQHFTEHPSSTEHGAGLWINESMLNNSCTPNCTWSNIADQMFIRTTKPIQKGDELCISYFPPDGSYEKRGDVFRRWIRPEVGFECMCDHCHFLKSRDDLRQLANEVHDGIRKVEEVARSCGTTRAMCAEEIFPSSRRQAILRAFSSLPLRLQHTRIADLHELEASILVMADDFLGALKVNQLAAKICYEVRGSGSWNYFADTWRIAGLAIVCKNFDLARESLAKIWNSPAFQAYPKEEAEEMFQDLTHRYVTQQMPYDPEYVIQIQELAYVVSKGSR